MRLAAIFFGLSKEGDELVEGEAGCEWGLLVAIFSLAIRRSLAPLVSGTDDEGAGDVTALTGEL